MISETSKKPMVVIESPFRGRTKKESELFKSYAQACMEDSIKRQEVPFASHLLYTQVLNDGDEHERNIGISLNLEMLRRADKSVVYTDLGISAGMNIAIKKAVELGIHIEYRQIFKKQN